MEPSNKQPACIGGSNDDLGATEVKQKLQPHARLERNLFGYPFCGLGACFAAGPALTLSTLTEQC